MATPTLVQFTSGSLTNGVTTGSYLIRLPNPSLSGNFLAVGFTRASGAVTTTVSDDQSQTWTAGPSNTDSVNGELSAIYYFPNTAAGVRTITIHFSVNKAFIAAAAWEFYNVAQTTPIDGSAGHSDLATPSTTVTSGSFTTTADGDLILMYGFRDNNTNTSFTQGSGFTLTSGDVLDGSFSQYGIQTTHGAINPTLTTDSAIDWTAVGAGFKSASAGTAPSAGIRVVGILHNSVNTGTSSTTSCPTNGNLIVVSFITPNGEDITSITDSDSETFTSTGSTQVGPGDSQMYYAKNTTANSNKKITLNYGAATAGANFIIYDVAGADTNSPFDLRAFASGTQSGGAGNITGATITPTTSNGLIIGSLDVANNFVSALPGAGFMFDSTVTTPNISLDPADQNNGWGHFYNANTSSVTFTWTSSGGAFAGWLNYLGAFKAPPQAGTTVFEDDSFNVVLVPPVEPIISVW